MWLAAPLATCIPIFPDVRMIPGVASCLREPVCLSATLISRSRDFVPGSGSSSTTLTSVPRASGSGSLKWKRGCPSPAVSHAPAAQVWVPGPSAPQPLFLQHHTPPSLHRLPHQLALAQPTAGGEGRELRTARGSVQGH